MPQSVTVLPSPPTRARFRAPGDKSISHRAFLLNVLGHGEALVRGCNPGADVASTRRALRALGVTIVAEGEGSYRLRGSGGKLRPASDGIDCGNSGTTLRLLAGLLAAQPFSVSLDGDASLRRRPMQRIAVPLRALGARVEGPNNAATPPLIVTGGELREPADALEVASAQVKSCLLLAAAAGHCRLRLREALPTRDHTERLLRRMGAALRCESGQLELEPVDELRCVDVEVPGDPSAAALMAAVVLAIPGSDVTFSELLLNPTRLGFVAVLDRMAAKIEMSVDRSSGGEESGRLHLRGAAAWQSTRIDAAEVPALIDEVPALAVLAALAESGASDFHGLSELRLKESDRLAAIVDLLGQAGVAARAESDTLWIPAGQRADAQVLHPADDHRLAMAAVALACGIAARRGHPVRVNALGSLAISHPGFLDALAESGVRLAA
jgi:3-phosphoshikimate 1-carboxyvinyltransferase